VLDRVLVQLDERRWLVHIGHGPLDAGALFNAFTALREGFGSIIVCLPPPMQWNGQEQLLPLLDSAVVSVPQGSCRLDELRDAIEELRDLGLEPQGVVVPNYSSRRDILGTEELRYTAIRPAGGRV
jgi:hypothetical protein